MRNIIPTSVSRAVSRQILVGKKNSPAILLAAGVIGVGATVVTACRATLKLEDVLEDAQRDLQDAKRLRDGDHPQRQAGTYEYTEQDYKKDATQVYIRTGVKLVRLYGPSVILATLSVAALTGSYRIQNTRIAGITAAYTAVDKAFKEYRGRVVEDLGEEKDREFRFGKETGTLLVEDTNGPKKVKKTTFGDGGGSMYSKIFDEYNKNWDPHPEYNILFLRGQQCWLNDELRVKGHLFLNDVYRALGMDDTPAGSQVGWLFDGSGDGYVDFGIWADRDMARMHDFLVGREGGIMLDFNVDGPIWDKIGKKKVRR